jgi:methionyl-tRNA formyltransferase
MTRLLRKEDGRLDWALPAPLLDRRIRAFTPWPGAQTTWEGRQLKVLQARPLAPDAGPGARAPGEVFAPAGAAPDGRLAVACGQGALELEVIQLEGKRALPASDFVRGQPGIVGARLGSPAAPAPDPRADAPPA